MDLEPKSSKTPGYHIFIEPAGALAEELRSIIRDLAAVHGSPVFEPHVTVLARIPEIDESAALEKAERLAALGTPCTLTLGELVGEDSFYRALYSRIEEQSVIREQYNKACEVFSLEKDPGYTAHLSLLYGNYAPEDIEQLKETLSYPRGASIIADKFHVYRSEGEVGRWYKIGEFPVGPTRPTSLPDR